MTRTGACLFTAALLGLGACYATGYSEESATGRRAKPDASVRKAPPPKRATAPAKRKKSEQTIHQAWHALCHAERLSGADPRAGTMDRADTVATWLVKHLRNKQVRYWYLSLDKLKPDLRPAAFRAEAKRRGFANCPLEKLLYGQPGAAARDAGT
jgi:hypothetical protein